jgi:hypothetical protein
MGYNILSYIYINGVREEYKDTIGYCGRNIHRTDGPAIEYSNGTVYWIVNNKIHRTTGPAVSVANGKELWYWNNIEYKEAEHPFNIFRKEYDLSSDYNSWPDDMKVLFKLTWYGTTSPGA